MVCLDDHFDDSQRVSRIHEFDMNYRLDQLRLISLFYPYTTTKTRRQRHKIHRHTHVECNQLQITYRVGCSNRNTENEIFWWWDENPTLRFQCPHGRSGGAAQPTEISILDAMSTTQSRINSKSEIHTNRVKHAYRNKRKPNTSH